MIQELLALALPVGKYILAAILMVAFYWFLFREKATFNNCRLYLLSIALVAIIISQFSIVVYTPPAQVVEIEATPAVSAMSNQLSSTTPPQTTTTPTTVTMAASTPAEKVTEPNKYIALLTVKNIVLAVYIAVTIVLFVLLFVQFFKILGLKRRGRLTTRDGFEVIESDEIPTPFSFYKTIFLSPNLTGAKLEMILKHEQWHIKHRHYVDVFIIEILVRLLWFNPVLWWVRRELRNVSEFHADRSVLDEGQDLYKYQTVILEEVMENNPYLANGFNNSFTRKRFIMMKNKCHIRFAMLRRALILPFFIGVFSLLCFTTGQSQVKYKTKTSTKTNPQAESYLKDSLTATLDTVNPLQANIFYSTDSIKYTPDNNSTLTLKMDKLADEKDIHKNMANLSNGLGITVKKLNQIVINNNPKTLKKDLADALKSLDIKKDEENVATIDFNDSFISSLTIDEIKNSANNLKNIKVELDKLRKEKPSSDLVKKFSGITFSMTKDELVLKIIENAFAQMLPNLNSTFTNTFHSSLNPTAKNQSQSNQTHSSNIVYATRTLVSSPELNQAEKERKELDEKVWKEAYRAKPEQISVSDIPFDPSETKVVRIEKNKNDTKVTLAIPIHFVENWVYFDRGFAIVDKRNQDRYMIRKLENDLPLDKTIIISNNKQKMIEITMVFPPLQKSVEFVDIIEYHTDGAVKMSNGKGNWKFMNIPIAQYSGRIFR